MGFFDFLKSKESRNAELTDKAIKEDFSIWHVMCMMIVTESTFFKRFPPKTEYCKIQEHCAWMLAAFIVFLWEINNSDETLAHLLLDKTYPLIMAEDEKGDANLSDKIEVLQKLFSAIIKDRSEGYKEHLLSIMKRIHSEYAIHAFLWIFCRRFLETITYEKAVCDFEIGADFLYQRFTEFVMSSKTIDYYNKNLMGK